MKWLYLLPGVVFAGVANVDRLWVFANISVGVCSIPNLIAILALNGAFFKLMFDYLNNQNKFAATIIDKSKAYIQTPKNQGGR